MALSIRARTRAILAAVATTLGTIGIVVVSSFPPSPANVDMDCRLPPDGGAGVGWCTAVLEPTRNQCAGLLRTGGEPPGADQDAGLTNGQVATARMLEQGRKAGAWDSWHAEADIVDGGVACWAEVRMSAIRTPDGRLDDQAPGFRDVVDAVGVGSIVVPGEVSLRGPREKRGGCRAHVPAGELPCANVPALADGAEPDGGP